MAKEQVHSPIFKQYADLKKKHPDAMLLFRVGDFYETYNDDAKACAEILGITLTTSRKYMDVVAMAGFPHHALDSYLPRLVRAGKRVAICNEMEDPKDKKLVKRGITELITATNNSNSTKMETKTDNDSKRVITNIATETIKALNGKLPATLNKCFSDAIGTLDFIALKYGLDARIEKDEMLELIRLAGIGLRAENYAK